MKEDEKKIEPKKEDEKIKEPIKEPEKIDLTCSGPTLIKRIEQIKKGTLGL